MVCNAGNITKDDIGAIRIQQSESFVEIRQESAAAFEAAIATARRTEIPFLELLARRDYIVHVLDAQGAREAQMAPLGDCIKRMVLVPAAYNDVLGAGIDAEAAVAAFDAAQKAS